MTDERVGPPGEDRDRDEVAADGSGDPDSPRTGALSIGRKLDVVVFLLVVNVAAEIGTTFGLLAAVLTVFVLGVLVTAGFDE